MTEREINRRLRIQYAKLLVENWLLELELIRLRILWVCYKVRNEWLRFVIWCWGGDPNG